MQQHRNCTTRYCSSTSNIFHEVGVIHDPLPAVGCTCIPGQAGCCYRPQENYCTSGFEAVIRIEVSFILLHAWYLVDTLYRLPPASVGTAVAGYQVLGMILLLTYR